ncbi:MAG: hypothetical protein JST40_11500 [Armatimonadetes bacterium]|nr:hypothetical protein [Armatimonadota bacterium]
MTNISMKLAAGAVAFGILAAGAVAKAPTPSLISEKSVKQVQPIRVAHVNPRTGKIMGGWKTLKYKEAANTIGRNAVTNTVAYDAMNSNPNGSTLNAAGFPTPDSYADFYGTTPVATGSLWWYGLSYFDPMWVNDMKLNAGTAGRTSRSYAVTAAWGPILDINQNSSVQHCLLAVQTYNQVTTDEAGPAAADIADYWLWDFGALGSGLWGLSIDEDNFSVPGYTGCVLPENQTGGGVRVFFAWTGPNNDGVYQLSTNEVTGTSPGGFYIMSPTDTYIPGTNPSDTDRYSWDDDNPVDYIHQDLTNTATLTTPYSESYDYTFSGVGFNGGTARLTDTNAFFVNNRRKFSGTINFEGYTGARPKNIVLDCDINDTTAATTDTGVNVIAGSTNSKFEIYDISSTMNHAYKIRIKSDLYLSKVVTVAAGTTDVNLGTITLTVGDCDLDNAITIFDYVVLSDAFDKTEADTDFYTNGPSGVPNSNADLDFDGAVTIFDYVLLSDNFDKVGEEL